MTEKSEPTYTILSSNFGSASNILAQLHSHEDGVEAKKKARAGRLGLSYIPKDPIESLPIHDLVEQDFSEKAVKPTILSITREDAGFSSAKGKSQLSTERVLSGQLVGMMPAHA